MAFSLCRKVCLTTLVFFSLMTLVHGEGSKQIWIDNHETNLYLCNDFINQCNNGNGDRTQFAIYDCDEPDRLYFVTNAANETVYLGFRGSGAGFSNHIVYRIKSLAGAIVKPQADLPTSGTGYISTIGQARVGPTQLYGAGGYTAISFHPPNPGTYYIEFNRVNNSSGNTSIGSFVLELFDITVADTVASLEKPGRVYSQAWQFQESGGDNCSAIFYVYSNDSIITSLELNDMSGGVWVTFCNQNGCANTGNFIEDRKSLNNQQAFVPQYKIFLNPPDTVLFPAATSLGQIIPPVTGERFCDNGNIQFHVTVDKPGNVEITLDFTPPYIDRLLATSVVAGENLINWNGLDGNGVAVPNNVNITFTVSYINGLTNLPLYDVEVNNNGFTIGLVSPPGSTPLVYWDDSNIPGGTTNLTGCLSPPGCHPWSDGDHNTMNTWWYNVSTTTTPVDITQYRNPQQLVLNQAPPLSYCAGTNGVPFSVTIDPNTDIYHWSYTGTGATIIQANPTNAFITVNFSAGATSGNIEVYGTNSNCSDPGPTSSVAVTIKPIPSVNEPFAKSICSGNPVNMPLSSTPAGAVYSYTSPAPTCTPNIVSCPAGANNQTGIYNTLAVSDLNTGTVVYHVTPALAGCTGAVQNITVNVSPLPDVQINSTTPTICSGETTNIQLGSTVPATVFNWTAVASSTDVTGFSPTGSGNILETIFNTGNKSEMVTYSIMPSVGSCSPAAPTNYMVTVYPIPDVIITSSTPTLCSGESTNISLSSTVTVATFSWTATASSPNVTGYAGGNGNAIAQSISNSGPTTETVTYEILPAAYGCSPVNTTSYTVTIYPIPDVVIASTTPTLCSGQQTDIQFSSSVAGSVFGWTASASSPNISGFPVTGSGNIQHLLVNSGFTTETVTYSVTPEAYGCSPASPTGYTVTVYPIPDVIINSTTPEICSGETTDILLSSSVAGTILNRTATASSPNLSGFSPTGTGNILETILNTGNTPETVTYSIAPEANGCSPSSPTLYTVTIYPIPDLIITSSTPAICSGETTNILLSSSVTGTTYPWTASASSPNVTGFTPSGSGDILETIVNSGSTVESVTFSITPLANGCSPAAPTTYQVTVYPIPGVTITSTTPTVCSGQTTSILLSSAVSGTSFSWTASASSPAVSGYSASGAGPILETLSNSAYTIETVTYQITPAANGCSPSAPTPYTVTVYPVADVVFTSPALTICSGQVANLPLQSNVMGTTFSWTATGSDPTVSGYSNGAGPLIQQTLSNSGYMMPNVTYTVIPQANGCTGTQNQATVTVNPLPVVSFIPCFDTITTTNAQPIHLRGALPPGGVYSGGGVESVASGGSAIQYYFDPAVAGPGTHEIKYTYTNDFGCLDSAKTFVLNSPFSTLNCGDTLLDIRDSSRYPTVEINGQCWMASNLNYGNRIPNSQSQRDNCIPEKYCYNDAPAPCALNSALYQWDEVMQYTNDNGAQGICPPGWHIPTRDDWNLLFANYISNGFAGNALKYTGYSGFNALLTGIRFHTSVWKYPANDPILRSILFWTSTASGTGKAWAHGMNEVAADIEYTPSVSFYSALVSNAFAVRCVKD